MPIVRVSSGHSERRRVNVHDTGPEANFAALTLHARSSLLLLLSLAVLPVRAFHFELSPTDKSGPPVAP